MKKRKGIVLTTAHQLKYRQSFGSLHSGDVFSYYNKVYVKTKYFSGSYRSEKWNTHGEAMNQYGFSISEFPNGCGVWYLGTYRGFEV